MDEEIVQPTTHNHAAPASTHIPRIKNEGLDDRGDDENIYTRRATWLTKTVFDAYEGLVSVASFMIGIGAVKKDAKTTLLSGTASLVAGACTMVIKKILYVKTQHAIEHAQKQRQHGCINDEKQKLPNTSTFASCVAYCFGASVPLLGGGFLQAYDLRLGVVAAVISVVLIVLGGLVAVMGKSPWLKSSFRFLIGGLLAMALTYGLTIVADCFSQFPTLHSSFF